MKKQQNNQPTPLSFCVDYCIEKAGVLEHTISGKRKTLNVKDTELEIMYLRDIAHYLTLYALPNRSAKPRRASRSAKTGKFVTKKQAAANPDTTVTETLSQNHKSQTCPPRRISNLK